MLTATSVLVSLLAAGTQKLSAPPPWPGTVDGCTFGESRDVGPRVDGRASDLAGMRKAFVSSYPASEVRQNIINVLRRDLPRLVIVRERGEADLILNFELEPPVASARGAERTGGWGVGCVSRRGGLGRLVGVLAFDGRWGAAESVVGAAFAEQFVKSYRAANGVVKQ